MQKTDRKKKMTEKRCGPGKNRLLPAQLPALLLFVVYPCIVHKNPVRTGLAEQPWFPDTAVQDDFFMVLRGVCLLVLALWMAAILLDRRFLQRKSELSVKQWLREFWPLVVFGMLAALSALFAVDKSLSLRMAEQMCETLWVLFAYLTVFFYFGVMKREEAFQKNVLTWMLTGAALQGAIGISQIAGHDFWSSAAGRWLIHLGSGAAQELQFAFGQGGKAKIYLSFYNPNYAAVYLLLVLPFAVYAVGFYKEKWQKGLSAALTLVLLICLWRTGSRAGLLTAAFLAAAAGFCCLKGARAKAVFGAGLIVCAAAYLFVGRLLPGKTTAERIYAAMFPQKKSYKLEEVTPRRDDVKIVFDGNEIYLTLEEDEDGIWFSAKDETGTPYKLTPEEGGLFALKDYNYPRLRFAAYMREGVPYLMMQRMNIVWEFVKPSADAPYTYVTRYGKTDTPVNAPYAFGEGREHGFSARIYLWSRTIPLLAEYSVIGSGPNTFALAFPQNDYVMRANLGVEMMEEIITRPHSLYLQTAVQTGVLSLLALLLFWGKALWRMAKRQVKNPCFYAALGFLVMGIANDMLLVTAPLFWAILGLGFLI